jgi:hypothetical protein
MVMPLMLVLGLACQCSLGIATIILVAWPTQPGVVVCMLWPHGLLAAGKQVLLGRTAEASFTRGAVLFRQNTICQTKVQPADLAEL